MATKFYTDPEIAILRGQLRMGHAEAQRVLDKKYVRQVRGYYDVDARGVPIVRKAVSLPPVDAPKPKPKLAPKRIDLQWTKLEHGGLRPMSFVLVYERAVIAVAPSPWSVKVRRRIVATVQRNISDRKTPWVARWRIQEDCNIERFPHFKTAIAWVQKDVSRVHPDAFKFRHY